MSITANNVLVAGNLIGTNAVGTGSINNSIGVAIALGATGNTIGGSTAAGARNVISGSNARGVEIDGSSNFVQGNFIGLNAAGTAALSNQFDLLVTGANNLIGGTSAIYRNVISEISSQVAVSIYASGATGNSISGNYIGTTAAGTADVSNIQAVTIADASNNVVGGTRGALWQRRRGRNGFLAIYLRSDPNSITAGNVVAGNSVGLGSDGTTAALGTSGIYLDGAGTTGNTIGGTVAAARNLIGSGASTGTDITIRNLASANIVIGNYIGVLADGSTTRGNLGGVRIFTGAFNNTIGGLTAASANVISGDGTGVSITGSGTTGNVVVGNFIGTNSLGTAAVANTASGVVIDLSATSNTIGGTASGAANVISGNSLAGVSIAAGNILVAGNLIGTNLSGTAAIPNGGAGVAVLSASGISIGAAVSGGGNLISGNLSQGVDLSGSGATGISVWNNTIGMNAAGTLALGNAPNGIDIESGAHGNTIGGIFALSGNRIVNQTAGFMALAVAPTAGSGNLILGNTIGLNGAGTATLGVGNGVFIASDHNTIGGTVAGSRNIIAGAGGYTDVWLNTSTSVANLVEGNYIGTNPAGTAGVGAAGGIAVDSASNNTIGGTAAGAGNVISGNASMGLDFQNAAGNLVAGNFGKDERATPRPVRPRELHRPLNRGGLHEGDTAGGHHPLIAISSRATPTMASTWTARRPPAT